MEQPHRVRGVGDSAVTTASVGSSQVAVFYVGEAAGNAHRYFDVPTARFRLSL